MAGSKIEQLNVLCGSVNADDRGEDYKVWRIGFGGVWRVGRRRGAHQFGRCNSWAGQIHAVLVRLGRDRLEV